jgi:hypothetical protein
MAAWHSLIGLAGVSLLLGRAAAALAPPRRRRWVAAAVFALAWMPIGSLPLAGYARGVTGDLSVTTLVWLVVGLLGAAGSSEKRAWSGVVALAAVCLYTTSLGWGSLDLYRLGYQPVALLALLAFVAATAWFRQHYVVLLCVVAAVAGHALELMESSNLWDYVVDPWVAVAAIYDFRPFRRNS